MYEAMCRVNDYTVIPHKMQTNYWTCLFLHDDEMLSKRFISNFEFQCGC